MHFLNASPAYRQWILAAIAGEICKITLYLIAILLVHLSSRAINKCHLAVHQWEKCSIETYLSGRLLFHTKPSLSRLQKWKHDHVSRSKWTTQASSLFNERNGTLKQSVMSRTTLPAHHLPLSFPFRKSGWTAHTQARRADRNMINVCRHLCAMNCAHNTSHWQRQQLAPSRSSVPQAPSSSNFQRTATPPIPFHTSHSMIRFNTNPVMYWNAL